MKKQIRELLEQIGEDVDREGIKETPTRVERLYKNLFYGYRKKLIVVNEQDRNNGDLTEDVIPITVFKNTYDEMLVRDVSCIGFCEHHILPFPCKVYVGIIPNKLLLGLNKIDKIVKYFAARLQIQERMVDDIANWINDNIKPRGVIVVIKGRHFCAEVQGDSGEFITTSVKGLFATSSKSKTEFLNMIK